MFGLKKQSKGCLEYLEKKLYVKKLYPVEKTVVVIKRVSPRKKIGKIEIDHLTIYHIFFSSIVIYYVYRKLYT